MDLLETVDTREVLTNAALVAMSVMLVLAGAEVALRFQQDAATYPKFQTCQGETVTQDNRMVFNATYGWKNRPDRQFLRRDNPDQTWHRWTINEEGFRDTYNTGSETVVVLGDSYVAGYLADDNETYPALLDHWARGTAFHNYGTGGYGTSNELRLYQTVSNQSDHDLVILGYYMFNDMKDNVANGSGNPRPQYELRDGKAVLVAPPRKPSDRDETQVRFAERPVTAVKDFLYDNTALYPVVANGVDAVLVRLGLAEPETQTETVYRPASGEELDRQLELTRALLDELAREADRNGADLLIVGFPERGAVNGSNPMYYPPDVGEPYWNAQRQMLRNVSQDHGNVEYLDLRPPLERAVENGNQVYGTTDEHLNEYGYRVAAEATLQRLRTDGYVTNATADPLEGREWSNCNG